MPRIRISKDEITREKVASVSVHCRVSMYLHTVIHIKGVEKLRNENTKYRTSSTVKELGDRLLNGDARGKLVEYISSDLTDSESRSTGIRHFSAKLSTTDAVKFCRNHRKSTDLRNRTIKWKIYSANCRRNFSRNCHHSHFRQKFFSS